MKQFCFSLFITLILFNSAFCQSGIPIQTGVWEGYLNGNRDELIDSMKKAGISEVTLNISIPEHAKYLRSQKLEAIPISVDAGVNKKDWIRYYTDGKYSIWEAEGEYGDTSYFRYDKNKMDQFTQDNRTFLKLNPKYSNQTHTILNGPYLYQELFYYARLPGEDAKVIYNAEFILKLERVQNKEKNSINNLLADSASICSLIVSHSYQVENTSNFELNNEVIDNIKILRKSDFASLNTFYSFPLEYFFNDSRSSPNGSPNGIQFRKGNDYVQYRIIWTGNPNYSLSIDKVIVSDKRGREAVSGDAKFKQRITKQVKSDILQELPVVSWFGIDEPNSIDNYEPMKAVIQYVKSLPNHRKIQFPMMGKYYGVFENPANPWGTYHLSPWKEMKKRIGDVSICQNFYFYDWPFQSNYDKTEGKSACNCKDFRIRNIDLVINNYRQAYELDKNFGVSVQCGSINNRVAKERNIDSYELGYGINLALLFGAKYISLYTYFAQLPINNVSGEGTNHGIVDFDENDNPIYTDKYRMLRYHLAPRLNGLFGKTLRRLIPKNQYAGSNGINISNGNVPNNLPGNFIKRIRPNVLSNNNYQLDYGYFIDTIGKNYLMIVNRYNSNKGHFLIEINNLVSFKNWKILSHTDSTNYFIRSINGESSFSDTLDRGEAGLYSIAPVVHYGGDLLYNETLSGSNTLKEDILVIKSGATLTVDGVYNIYKDITVETGGKLDLTNKGSLKFFDGAKVNGNYK